MISDEQIERFFKKECTAREARLVADWLQAHPEAAANYLPEPEWQNTSLYEGIPAEIYDAVWSQLNRKIRRRNNILLLRRTAAAACIIGCIACCFFIVSKNNSAPSLAIESKPATGYILFADTEYNYTTKARRILLADSSVISLLPASAVWFDTPFAKDKRDIHLKGQARFEVAKNKEKPFTVYAGVFATTALGTEFTVKQQNNAIKIELLHGKVVIRAVDAAIKNWKNIYLLPGEQMIYNNNEKLPTVSLIQVKENNTPKQTIQHEVESETADNLIFNSSPITIVLQKLGAYYQVNIQFIESDLKDISFTGVIAKKDAVQNVLKVIAQMNGLSVEEKDSSFIISKMNLNNLHP